MGKLVFRFLLISVWHPNQMNKQTKDFKIIQSKSASHNSTSATSTGELYYD